MFVLQILYLAFINLIFLLNLAIFLKSFSLKDVESDYTLHFKN